MIDAQRPVHVANEVMMRRSANWSGPFLLVEGRDDRLFMERHICRGSCSIKVVRGKQNVCDVMEILNQRGFRGAVGIVDADLDRVTGSQPLPDNVFMHDHHDLETMLLCSEALEAVLIEFGSRCKIQSFGRDPLDVILERALPLGILRLHSARENLGLAFDDLDYSWLARRDFEVNVGAMVRAVLNRSRRHDISEDDLISAIGEVGKSHLDPREICNGTDLLEVLSIGLLRALGNQTPQRINADILRSFLRASYSSQEFHRSSLGGHLRMWEAQSDGFRVLRQSD